MVGLLVAEGHVGCFSAEFGASVCLRSEGTVAAAAAATAMLWKINQTNEYLGMALWPRW